MKRVKQNKGSPGIDGMTVDQLSAYLREHWPALREQLLAGTYQPQPVRQHEIPKSGGGVQGYRIKSLIDAELDSILGVRPDLVLVALADGAEENWRYFDSPKWLTATKIVDFGHGAEHLKAGLTAYHGADAIEGRAEYERLKVILRDKAGGVDDVIAELKRLRRKMPARSSKARKQTLTDEITYFTNQRERMNYASYQARGLPIGSGIVEATCKTLATQRLKRSGMSWRDGKQAILTIRSLQQSDRWSRAWPLASAAFKQPVATVKSRVGLRVITQLDRAA